MNKNFKQVLGVALVSTALMAASCGEKTKTKTTDSIRPTEVEARENTLKIGYYDVDSLNEQYKLVKDISAEIETKMKKMTSGFEAEVKSFEKWATDMEKKLKEGLLLSSEEKKFMEQFQRRQMELGQKEQQLSMEAQQMQSDNFLKATNRVNDFVKRYAQENGFDMILQYQIGGQVTYINDSFNITSDIISGLNKEYEELKNDLNK
jgi:outer membrane protein